MKTYFIIDSFGLLKIGKTMDFKSRFSNLRTANPHIAAYYLVEGDFEKPLHCYFNFCRYKGEWFNLREEYIISKSIMNFEIWLIHEFLLTLDAIKNDRINELIDIRLKRHIIK